MHSFQNIEIDIFKNEPHIHQLVCIKACVSVVEIEIPFEDRENSTEILLKCLKLKTHVDFRIVCHLCWIGHSVPDRSKE